jgi:hypothetical protein
VQVHLNTHHLSQLPAWIKGKKGRLLTSEYQHRVGIDDTGRVRALIRQVRNGTSEKWRNCTRIRYPWKNIERTFFGIILRCNFFLSERQMMFQVSPDLGWSCSPDVRILVV